DHALFPERVGGQFATFHRRPPSIWLAFSGDMRAWGPHVETMRPRPRARDGKRTGAGGPPIRTHAGWPGIYHGHHERHVHRIGPALLDLADPTKVLKRPQTAVLVPEETWEIKGDVPNVVFGTANPVVDGEVYLYYGGADRVIGLATAPLDELLAWTVAEG